MIRILISACLLGQPVRYDGTARTLHHPLLERWRAEGRLVPVCPECEGKLPTPRAPAEIQGGSGADVLGGQARVIDNLGQDQSAAFIQGAERTLAIARQQRTKLAILTENSPSCGSQQIYDGHFGGRKITGSGVTTALLRAEGIAVFSPTELADALSYLEQLEARADS